MRYRKESTRHHIHTKILHAPTTVIIQFNCAIACKCTHGMVREIYIMFLPYLYLLLVTDCFPNRLQLCGVCRPCTPSGPKYHISPISSQFLLHLTRPEFVVKLELIPFISPLQTSLSCFLYNMTQKFHSLVSPTSIRKLCHVYRCLKNFPCIIKSINLHQYQ